MLTAFVAIVTSCGGDGPTRPRDAAADAPAEPRDGGPEPARDAGVAPAVDAWLPDGAIPESCEASVEVSRATGCVVVRDNADVPCSFPPCSDVEPMLFGVTRVAVRHPTVGLSLRFVINAERVCYEAERAEDLAGPPPECGILPHTCAVRVSSAPISNDDRLTGPSALTFVEVEPENPVPVDYTIELCPSDR